MFAQTANGKQLHISDDGRVTRCGKRINLNSWSVNDEPVSPGNGMHDCGQCGDELQFAAHRQELKIAVGKRNLERQEQAAAQRQCQVNRKRTADDLANLIVSTLREVGLRGVTRAALAAGDRIDVATTYNGEKFTFTFTIA